MSFRHTYVTEYLYKYGLKEDLEAIRKVLEKEGTVNWCGNEIYGYFHGIIKDSDSFDTKNRESEIKEKLEKVGVDIAIVFE